MKKWFLAHYRLGTKLRSLTEEWTEERNRTDRQEIFNFLYVHMCNPFFVADVFEFLRNITIKPFRCQ